MKPANNAPLYAAIYHELAELCRSKGYALAVHGSLARDFDLVAIPWNDTAASPEEVIHSMIERWSTFRLLNDPVTKAHGRKVYTLLFSLWGEAALDLGFMPLLQHASD